MTSRQLIHGMRRSSLIQSPMLFIRPSTLPSLRLQRLPSTLAHSFSSITNPSTHLHHHRLTSSTSSIRSFSTTLTHPPPPPPPTPSPSAATSSASASSSVSPRSESTPVVSDAGVAFSFLDPEETKKTTWRRNLFLVVLIGGIIWHFRDQRRKSQEWLDEEVISCRPPEIHDLINVFHFTTKDLESLYAKTMQRFPRGEVTLDDFSQLLAGQAQLVRARRRHQREERAGERAREQATEDRKEVILEREIERRIKRGEECTGLKTQLEQLYETHKAHEELRDKLAKADEDENFMDTHADNQFVPMDTCVFFRTTQPKVVVREFSYKTGKVETNAKMDVRDLFLGLANVLFDHEELDEKYQRVQGLKHIPKTLDELRQTWSARDQEIFTRKPESKLHFALRVTDEDRDGQLTLAEAERMIGRLIRTGHCPPESLVQVKLPANSNNSPSSSASSTDLDSLAFLPAEYIQRTPNEIIQAYWHEIAHQRRTAAVKKHDELLSASSTTPSTSAAPATVSASPPSPPSLPDLNLPYHPATKITFAEFLAASRHFTDARENIGFWYLSSTMPTGTSTGGFYRWRHRIMNQWRHIKESITFGPEEEERTRMIEAFLV